MKNTVDTSHSNNRIAVLADMHLRPLDARRRKAADLAVQDNERLARFLTEIGDKVDTLVLLGDTFNFWFERHSHVVGDYYTALNLFKIASEQGLSIHHVCGNRDFVVGEGLGFDPATRYRGFFRLKRGFTVSRLCDYGIEPHGPRMRLHQAGKTITFLHGDSLCGKQRFFMGLRWMMYGPLGRLAMRWAPWGIIKAFAARIQSKVKKRRQINDPESVLLDASIKREIAMGADMMLCGHLHTGYEKQVEVAGRKGQMHILPAWLDGYFGIVEKGELTVYHFE